MTIQTLADIGLKAGEKIPMHRIAGWIDRGRLANWQGFALNHRVFRAVAIKTSPRGRQTLQVSHYQPQPRVGKRDAGMVRHYYEIPLEEVQPQEPQP